MDLKQPTVKFLHLFSTHRPHILQEDCRSFSEQEPEVPREAALTQSHCALSSFVKFLSGLKKKGIYQDSMIVLLADTGEGFWREPGNGQTEEEAAANYRIGRANPTFLVKLPKARGALRIADAAIQNADLPATVCGTLKDCEVPGGSNVFDLDNGNPRTRYYNFYYFRDALWKRDVVDQITRYEIRGPLRRPSSWHEAPSNSAE